MRRLFLLWLGATILIAIGLSQTHLIAFLQVVSAKALFLTRGTCNSDLNPTITMLFSYTYAVNGKWPMRGQVHMATSWRVRGFLFFTFPTSHIFLASGLRRICYRMRRRSYLLLPLCCRHVFWSRFPSDPRVSGIGFCTDRLLLKRSWGHLRPAGTLLWTRRRGGKEPLHAKIMLTSRRSILIEWG